MTHTNVQSCSVQSTVATTVLSSYRVLAVLVDTPFQQPLGEEALKEAVYLTYQPWAARHPDHMFQSAWRYLLQEGASASSGRKNLQWSAMALRILAGEFVEPKHGVLTVKLDKFGTWQQSVLSRVSGLPVQAAAKVAASHHDFFRGARGFGTLRAAWSDHAENVPRITPLISPHDAMVEDYIEREGLHETHLHLNGSTHAEVCWLRALRSPKAEIKDFEKRWNKMGNPDSAKVREMARAINPVITPTALFWQLYIAARLRKWLVAAASGSLQSNAELPFGYEAMREDAADYVADNHPWQLSKETNCADEVVWMTALLTRLETSPSIVLDRMLHCYLVLQNQYYRLLVQSEEQFGFDQFQKLTLTELREPAEEDYLHRFQSMHGQLPHRSRVGYLEGRFAPKTTLRANAHLLKNILGAYWQYLGVTQGVTMRSMGGLLDALNAYFEKETDCGRSRHRLALVAHFIKSPWRAIPAHKAGPYRFYKQRLDLEGKVGVLLQTLHAWPRLSQWVRGIDAAANELHAPPEVFASCFRMCRQAGLTRRTYHVGEDFPHLLTGLRQMLDALELLDLRDGDRMGHGTAMGISPRLWLERMPENLLVNKGEWMLDLLGAWRMLRRSPDATKEVNRVECALAELASHIFGRSVSAHELDRAMRLRHLHLGFVMKSRESSWEQASFNDLLQSEAKLVRDAQEENAHDLEMLWTWQSDSALWQRSEALHEVKAAFFSPEIFVRIQQVLMEEVNQRRVVVETLPSSNVRISHYHNVQEHHALRWMRVPGFFEPEDPEVMVSLGSDDPGIFAGDLNGEFYQLYATLRSAGIGDKMALNYLAPLNERGRQYRFHDPRLA